MKKRTFCHFPLLGAPLIAALLAAGSSNGVADPPSGDIYVVSASGGPRRALTTTHSHLQPSISGDGRLIAYSSPIGIRLMNADGSEQRPLGTASGERPQWSPNGRRLVYTSANADLCYPGPAQRCVVAEVWVVKADGTGKQKLFSAAVHPVWSPGGRRLAFREFVVGESGEALGSLNVAWPDGSHVRTLYRGGALDGMHSVATWSPDGKWIAFNTWRNSQHRLFLVRSDGSRVRRLTSGAFPAWSPTGKLIAFERDGGVWVISPKGKHARRVAADGRCPTWSPAGKRIAYLAGGSLRRSLLMVVRPNGRGRRILAEAADCYERGWAEPSPPAWSRDGRWLYFTG